MRMLPLVLSAVVALSTGPAAAQEKEGKAKPPKSGDTIVVEGCLNGTMLEGAGATPADGSNALLPSGLNFQLKGKKNLLKDLVAKHDGQIVEITGVLKSNLDAGAGRGTTIGKTRIVIGVQSTSPDRAMMPGTQEMLPVLEVKSFESAATNCRR
jgi:hypothetical protein